MKKNHQQDAAPTAGEPVETGTVQIPDDAAENRTAETSIKMDEPTNCEAQDSDVDAFAAELNDLRAAVTKHETEAKEHYERLQYMAAEFDNYRRRTQKEKDKIYTDASAEVITAFLPVMDNLERATKACEVTDGCSTPEAGALRSGIELVTRQFMDTLEKMGVREIETLGKSFDPTLHNAVMHIEDDAYGDGEIVEQFQKGYAHKNGTVMRHSMVKVAN